ncbi:histidine phosphatase family protein [Clostridium sp. DJ247]|uniref:histidine phosphatase family protein n=1 Tax=Clostridium sp. DJ247 TaxID=2726188 RepID=UPI001626CB12|nr:histidine phosphatase family protein [Clostridium sp. DJ247]MBC2581712.1 histidine phosphatase family protein [Clostridium sp. DJ247]
MKTKVFLVRHGETEWNRLGKFQGCKDINLSEEGVVQAQYLSKKFNDNFDYIYTSPLKRAMQTAEVIAANKEIRPIIVNELREINFGEWEGLTIKEISNNFPEEFNDWRNDKVEAPMCGGDLSLKNASRRAKNAITEIVARHKEKKILIVAHGGIIKAGLIGLFEWDMTMYHKINLGNTAICEIDFDLDLNPTIVKINDTSHLPNNYIIKSYV